MVAAMVGQLVERGLQKTFLFSILWFMSFFVISFVGKLVIKKLLHSLFWVSRDHIALHLEAPGKVSLFSIK